MHRVVACFPAEAILTSMHMAGQTGSGKTYTMGSAFHPGGSTQGVIPRTMVDIFARIAETTDADFLVRVSFVEIFKVGPVSASLPFLLCRQHLGCQAWPRRWQYRAGCVPQSGK